jgi:hypothetical protein
MRMSILKLPIAAATEMKQENTLISIYKNVGI